MIKRLMRGQTLVLFALMLLGLTLMVLITIGLGVRLHERTEQQLVADAAAYSEAVVTARTYNAMATLNRAMIAQLASVAAAQSLISWAGYYHGTLNQGRDLLAFMVNTAAPACADPLRLAYQAIIEEDRRLIDLWEPPGGGYEGINGYDVRSADYIRRFLYKTALTMADDQQVIYARMLQRVAPTSGAGMAGDIADAARQGSPWRANPLELYATDQPLTRTEQEDVIIPQQDRPKYMAQAFMAARGTEPFVSSREATTRTGDLSAADYVATRLNKVMDKYAPNPLVARVTDFGTSYFGERGPTRDSGIGETDGYDGQAINRRDWQGWRDLDDGDISYVGAWAQDTGVFRFDWPSPPLGCAIPEPTEDSFGYVVTTGPTDDRDNHMWRRGDRAIGDYREWNDPRVDSPPIIRHSFEDEPTDAVAPSLWPVFVDYDDTALETDRTRCRGGRRGRRCRGRGRSRTPEMDLDGMPKNMVTIVRNYSARTGDPWELNFRFQFSASGPADQINFKANRFTLNRSVAISSGLTYYHRGSQTGPADEGHSREPPNFLNPFWRATLVASDIDEPFNERGKDAEDSLNDLGETEQVQAAQALRTAGFEGFQ